MRLATIFLIASMLQVSAATMAQQVTLKKSDVTLRQLFKEVRKQTGYSVIWGSEEFNANERIAVDFNRSSLQEVFNKVVAGKGYSYLIDEKTIIIESRKGKVDVEPAIKVATIDVTGKVVDEQGRPLAGASVRLKEGSITTTTSYDGRFTLKNVEEGALILISFIGFETRELKAKNNVGTIEMALTNNKLDEVQIQAYGVTSRRLSTSNIGTVKAEDIEKQPVNNPLLALKGRVAGIQITQANGYAGGAVTVRIQGQNSMRAGNDPFYVIDGVPYTSTMLTTMFGNGILGQSQQAEGAYNGNSGAGNPLSFINPSDIESIDVLKDADATAIYGSRAANGAILITTKKGRAGKVKVDVNLQNGFSEVANKLELLNTQQYLMMQREAMKNSGITVLPPGSAQYDIDGTWDQNRSTDWQKELIGGTAKYTDLQTSVSGGTLNTQYRFGASYHRETTILPFDFGYGTGSVNFSLTTTSNNQRFRLQISTQYADNTNRLPSIDLTTSALTLPPNAPPLLKADGSINWDENGNSPISSLESKLKMRTNNLISNLQASYEVLKGLNFKTSLGYTNLQGDHYYALPLSAYAPAERPLRARQASYSYNNIHSWLIEPQLTYNKVFANHKFDIVLGATVQQNYKKGTQFSGTGYASDELMENPQFAISVTAGPMAVADYKYNAGFARINYNYADRYILNLTARRDGSSRFGPENRFHNFGAIGVAWLLSNEKFLRLPKVISFAKIKSSYGMTGNDQIGDYTFLDLYNPLGVQIPYQGSSSFVPTKLYNPKLEWEETIKFNVGLDLGFWKDRILFGANYAVNRSDNQLNQLTLPTSTGFTSVTYNFKGQVENRSLELNLSTENIQSEKFKWKSNINFTRIRNELASLPDQSKMSTLGLSGAYLVGYPLGTRPYLHYMGVDPNTGLFLFRGMDGNPTSSPNYATDATEFISAFPKFSLGMSNDFTFKEFSLSVFLHYINQIKEAYLFAGGGPGTLLFNQPTSVLGRWTRPGDVATFQKFSYPANTGALASSDGYYTDASFLRLSNVSFSWRAPEKWSTRLKLSQLRLFVQGQNLMTFTKYTGLDPETGASSLPPLRTLTLGLNLTF